MSISNVQIIDIVEQHLVKEANNNDRDYTYFHASSWNKCQRKTAYLYHEAYGHLKVDKSAISIDSTLERIFGNGHGVHSRWNGYFRNCAKWLRGVWECRNCAKLYGAEDKLGIPRPIVCECRSGHTEFDSFEYQEVGFSDEETSWGGHVDAILDMGLVDPGCLNLSDEDRCIIVDLKSINDYGWKALTGPPQDHISQMQIYLSLSGLKEGRFIYENKNNQKLKEYVVMRDDAFIEQQREEAISLKFVVEHTNSSGKYVLPQRDSVKFKTSANTECKRCQFRGHCWK